MMRDIAALGAYLEQSKPFDWDGNCCVFFALGAVRAQFGRAPNIGHRWSTARGAARVLKRVGGLEAATDAIFERIAPGQAMRGDIAGCPDPELGIALLVIEGMTLAGPCEGGTRRVPRSMMTMAWRAAPGARDE